MQREVIADGGGGGGGGRGGLGGGDCAFKHEPRDVISKDGDSVGGVCDRGHTIVKFH